MREDDAGRYIDAEGNVVPLSVFIKVQENQYKMAEETELRNSTIKGLSKSLYRPTATNKYKPKNGVIKTRRLTKTEIQREEEKMANQLRRRVMETFNSNAGLWLTSRAIADTLKATTTSITSVVTTMVRFLEKEGLMNFAKDGKVTSYKMMNRVDDLDRLYSKYLEYMRQVEHEKRLKKVEGDEPKKEDAKEKGPGRNYAVDTDFMAAFTRRVVDEYLKEMGKPLISINGGNNPSLSVKVDVNVKVVFGLEK